VIDDADLISVFDTLVRNKGTCSPAHANEVINKLLKGQDIIDVENFLLRYAFVMKLPTDIIQMMMSFCHLAYLAGFIAGRESFMLGEIDELSSDN